MKENPNMKFKFNISTITQSSFTPPVACLLSGLGGGFHSKSPPHETGSERGYAEENVSATEKNFQELL